MIVGFLRHNGLRYEQTPDGDFVVPFGFIEEADCELTMVLHAAGDDGTTYVIGFFTHKLISRENWPQALVRCNTWNQKYRWPTAYLWTSVPGNDNAGEIVLAENLNLAAGIHAELLDDLTSTVLRGAVEFWSWMNSQTDVG
jgi:hypothetical protein